MSSGGVNDDWADDDEVTITDTVSFIAIISSLRMRKSLWLHGAPVPWLWNE